MGVFKCKMCGGLIESKKDTFEYECEYCGKKQTIYATADYDCDLPEYKLRWFEEELKKGFDYLEFITYGNVSDNLKYAEKHFNAAIRIFEQSPRPYIGKLLVEINKSQCVYRKFRFDPVINEAEMIEKCYYGKLSDLECYKKAFKYGDDNLKKQLTKYDIYSIYNSIVKKYSEDKKSINEKRVVSKLMFLYGDRDYWIRIKEWISNNHLKLEEKISNPQEMIINIDELITDIEDVVITIYNEWIREIESAIDRLMIKSKKSKSCFRRSEKLL